MKRGPKLPHPIARAIEDVFAAGHTPRLQVDARRSDVLVPDHVRARWGARLVIDLDPSWPLALEHGEDGLGVDLAFQGIVQRCRFAWPAIYVVMDRATGKGLVIEGHLPPAELPEELAAPAATVEVPRSASERPLRLVRASAPPDGPPPAAVEEAAATEAPAPSVEGGRATPVVDAAPLAPEGGPKPPTADDEARARRARFRVIDGGG